MIVLNKNTSQFVIFTLREKQVLTNPNFIVRFVQRSTKEEKKFLIEEDASDFPQRYNKLEIDTHTLSTLGEYEYYVYETAENNLNINGKNLLECGIMVLKDNNNIYTARETDTSYVTR